MKKPYVIITMRNSVIEKVYVETTTVHAVQRFEKEVTKIKQNVTSDELNVYLESCEYLDEKSGQDVFIIESE